MAKQVEEVWVVVVLPRGQETYGANELMAPLQVRVFLSNIEAQKFASSQSDGWGALMRGALER